MNPNHAGETALCRDRSPPRSTDRSANIISATPGNAINPVAPSRPSRRVASRRGPPALISGSISEIDAGVAAPM